MGYQMEMNYGPHELDGRKGIFYRSEGFSHMRIFDQNIHMIIFDQILVVVLNIIVSTNKNGPRVGLKFDLMFCSV